MTFPNGSCLHLDTCILFRLNEAFNLVKQGGTLVAINKSRYMKTEQGLSIGTGAFVSTLGKLLPRDFKG